MSKKKKKKIRQPQYRPKQVRTLKEWWQDQAPTTQKKIRYIFFTICAVLVIALVYYIGIYDDGSLRIRKDAVAGRQDSWLIAELDKGKRSSYYKLAEVAVPDGFAADEESAFGYTITSSSNTDHKTNFSFVPLDEENPIDLIGVYPLKTPPEKMIGEVYQNFVNIAETSLEGGNVTEVRDYETEAGVGKYFIYEYAYQNAATETTGKLQYNQCLTCYIPTKYKESGILISVNIYPESTDNYVDEQVLMDALELTLSNIKLTGIGE